MKMPRTDKQAGIESRTISFRSIIFPVMVGILGNISGTDGHGQIRQEAYIKASNSGSGDNFGFSAALSADTLVIGAVSEDSAANLVNGSQSDNSASASGAAYVFVRVGNTWFQQAYLKASNCGAGDSFGWSVAISGDTIVVGAYAEDSNATGINGNPSDNSATNSGAAYVFVRVGNNWIQQAYLKASNTELGDNFGWSVAASGDTVVVGARLEDSSSRSINFGETNNDVPSAGAAYVFTRQGTNWSQQAYLKASNTDRNDQFGRTVSVSRDTLVVSATFEDSNARGINGDQSNNAATNSGAAYVFVRSGSNWHQQAYLKASNADEDDEFGISTAIFGDTVVIGSRNEDSGARGVNGVQDDNSITNSGAAYVFVRDGTNWHQEAYLKASTPGAQDSFGKSVAIWANTVVVGAFEEDSIASGVNIPAESDNTGDGAGSAYVFVRNGVSWNQQAYLKASNTDGPGTRDNFGWDVVVSGDTTVILAPGEDSNATGINGNQYNNTPLDFGAAYAFTGIVSGLNLAIEQVGQFSRVSWPFPARGFVLEESARISDSPAVSWTQVTSTYQTNASHVFVDLPQTTNAGFYRLRRF